MAPAPQRGANPHSRRRAHRAGRGLLFRNNEASGHYQQNAYPLGGLGDTPLFLLLTSFKGLYEGSFNLPLLASFLLFLELVSPDSFDGVDL